MTRGLALLALALVHAVAGPALAHRGDRVYPIFELADDVVDQLDVHDGSVADWLTLVGPPTILATDISRSIDPGDLDFRVWLAWHGASDRLFVAMERTDDVYTNDYTVEHECNYAMDSFDSALGFAIDGDHGGGQFNWGSNGWMDHGAWMRSLQQAAQAYMAIAETFDGSPTLRSGFLDSQSGRWWYAQPPWADGGGRRFGEQPTVTVTEFYVTPMDRLDPFDETVRQVVDLQANDVIGFYLYVADFDLVPVHMACGEGVDSWWQLPWGAGSANADAMVDGLLLPATVAGGAAPVLADTAWARVKMGFPVRAGSSRATGPAPRAAGDPVREATPVAPTTASRRRSRSPSSTSPFQHPRLRRRPASVRSASPPATTPAWGRASTINGARSDTLPACLLEPRANREPG